MKAFSLWATVFTMLYYLCKGMWRKALSLLGLCLAVSAFLVGLEDGFGVAVHHSLYHLPSSLAATLAGLSARVDLYRSRVLGQTFWW